MISWVPPRKSKTKAGSKPKETKLERHMDLFGANADAYNSRDEEVLLCGPAGTGKTLAWLSKILTFCDKYPGTRVLFARKTRESLTESGLVTWERDILGFDHHILKSRPILRKVRQDYTFPNRSTIVVCGLDKPDKALSSDYDLIYLLEATDFEQADYETLTGRLRTGAAPYQQLIADCNPTFPTHWLYRRAMAGKIKLYNSKHKDNPRWFNLETEQWTPDGEKYLARLHNMTGARKKRFAEGVWAAAEGLVYDNFNPAYHLLEQGWRPPDYWARFWTIDWGFTAPLVLQMWAVDEDGRLYLYREIYMTGMRVEELGKRCKRILDACEEVRPMSVVTDHDPEAQATFAQHSGLHCENAWKEDKYAGIELVQSRFDLADDGKPRLFIVNGARHHDEDAQLVDAGRPACTQEELAGYVWNTKDPDKLREEPIKINDHGCDAMRYACVYGERFATTGNYISTGLPSQSVHGDIRKKSW